MTTISKLKIQTRCVLVFFLVWVPSQALIGADMHAYLLSAEQEASDLVPAFGLPRENRVLTWFDQPEARFEVSDQEEQSYGFRFRPRFGGERSAERTLHELEIQRRDLMYESVLNNALKRRYMALIDILAGQEETEYLIQEVNLLSAKINLSRKLVQTTAFDPTELEMDELEHSQLEQQKTLNSARLETIITQSGFTVDEMSTLLASRSAWLLPLSELVDRVTKMNIPSDDTDSSLPVQIDRTELQMAQEDLNLARKKNKSLLKFMELKYLNKQGDSSEVTLGVAISFGGSKSRFFSRELDVGQAQTSLVSRQLDTAQFLHQKRSTLYWFLDRSKAIQDTIDDISQRISRHQKIGNPHLVLELKQKKLSQERRLSDTRIQALRSYIEFLHSSGQLVEQPLQNWLRVGQPRLKGDQK